MKAFSFFLVLIVANLAAVAQIPNAGFESWSNPNGYNNPADWDNLNATTKPAAVYTCQKGTPGSPGTAYLKLVSKTVSGMGVMPGVAVSGVLNPATKKAISGFAMAQRPTSLTGKWQHMAYGNDEGFISIHLTRWNAAQSKRDTVGAAHHNLGAMVMSWANFTIPITYTSPATPDSCIITLSSSGASPVVNSYLYVDNLAFTGTVSDTVALIPIPDTLSGSAISLNLHQDSVSFFGGKKTHTFGVNQYAYLGPTLVLDKGQQVSLTVNNQIGDTTSIHWHGLHVAPSNDGGPHLMLMDGDSWNPQFTVLDRAATYWYHPHFHGNTALHAIKGIAGMILVRDSAEAALALPRSYGQDDFPIIVQSIEFDPLHQSMPRGMQDSILLVNGTRANQGHVAVLDIPAQVVRLRLLNASGERTFLFGLSDSQPFSVIGSDGGLLAAPVVANRIRVSPGERYEILVDASALQGQILKLMSYASELPMGVQGGPTMPMPPGNPPMNSPLNGLDFSVLEMHVVSATAQPVTDVPASLVTVTPWNESQSNITRTINFTAQSMMVMDGPFYFNGLSYDMDRIDYRIPLNNTEIWTLTNQTMVAHPFHLHDVQFYLLDRDGNPVPEEERGRKDVVLVESQETVRFITKFETFADTLTPYVFHCHVLMHEDDGMMGQFLVVPQTTGVEPGMLSTMLVYPNPLQAELHIRAAWTATGNSSQTTKGCQMASGGMMATGYTRQIAEGWTVRIVNMLGQTQYYAECSANQDLFLSIPCADWKEGVYFIEVIQGGTSSLRKIVK